MIGINTFSRWFPFLGWMHRVTPGTLRLDIFAALTGAMIVLPQAVAFASIAGLPPQYGLYAAMVPAVVAAFWGSSWHLVSGPTTAISIVVFASVSPLALPGSERYIGLVLTLTLLAGAIQLAMGLARMGALVNLISHTVILGFTAGASFLIAASQIKNFFGLDIPGGLHFHQVILYAGNHLNEAHLWVVLVGAVTLVSGLLARHFIPRVPYMIVAMIVGSVVAAVVTHLVGAEQSGIKTVGTLVAAFPPLSMPDLSFSTLRAMLFPAAIVAVLALTEAVAIARSIAVRSGQRIDANQEFIGQGLSNVAGAFFSAYTSSGSFNRSGVNYASGAQTPLAAAMSAVFLLLIALLAAPLAAYLPVPAMAAILFIVAWGLIDFQHIEEIIRRHRRERIILAMTFIGTLVDLEKGIFLGILVSLIFYLSRTSQPAIQERAPATAGFGDPRRKFIEAGAQAPGCPQIAFLRVRGSIYFGAVDHVRNHLHHVDEASPKKKWVMLLAQGINFIDLAGAQLLAQEAKRRHAFGGGLFLIGAQHSVWDMMSRGGQLEAVGPKRLVAHKGDAVRAAYQLLDNEVCRQCTLRVFNECQDALPNGEPRAPEPPNDSSPNSNQPKPTEGPTSP